MRSQKILLRKKQIGIVQQGVRRRALFQAVDHLQPIVGVRAASAAAAGDPPFDAAQIHQPDRPARPILGCVFKLPRKLRRRLVANDQRFHPPGRILGGAGLHRQPHKHRQIRRQHHQQRIPRCAGCRRWLTPARMTYFPQPGVQHAHATFYCLYSIIRLARPSARRNWNCVCPRAWANFPSRPNHAYCHASFDFSPRLKRR